MKSKKIQCFHNGGPGAFLCTEDYITISSWMKYSKVSTCTLPFVMHPVIVLCLCWEFAVSLQFCVSASKLFLSIEVQTWAHRARELIALGVSSSVKEWGLLAIHLNFLALWVRPFSAHFTCVPGVSSGFNLHPGDDLLINICFTNFCLFPVLFSYFLSLPEIYL